MQNRYVGDYGDYIKLSILRAVPRDVRIGVAWWLYPDESHNSDGRHTRYLKEPDKWKSLDPDLFEKLGRLIEAGVRNVSLLESSEILPNAIFARDPLPVWLHHSTRAQARKDWFVSVQRKLSEASLIFVDPDNGLQPKSFSLSKARSGKSVAYDELEELADNGRSVIVYHHQTRRKGGHLVELEYLSDMMRARFRIVDAIRAAGYSPRVFFVLNGTEPIRASMESLAARSSGRLEWYADK